MNGKTGGRERRQQAKGMGEDEGGKTVEKE